MKKISKIVLFCLTFLLFILCSLFAIGEYFCSYSIIRKGDKPAGSERNVTSLVLQNDAQTIEKNKQIAISYTQTWLGSVKNEALSITSNDGLKLVGAFFPNGHSHKYAIIIHGYSNQKENFYDIVCKYHEKGFNVLAPDLRAHGKSEGKYIGMGWLDKEDIKLWINKIISIDDKAQIVLHGVSMGAATVMMTSGEPLPQNIKAVIEDCGYTSVKDIFSSELKKRFNLPSFPIINFAAFSIYMHAGYNIFTASCVDQIAKSSIPFLIIHGTADNFVPVDMAYKIKDSANIHDILIVKGAGHTESRFLAPEAYYNKVWNFINYYLHI